MYRSVKIVIVGNAVAGKNKLLKAFINNAYPKHRDYVISGILN